MSRNALALLLVLLPLTAFGQTVTSGAVSGVETDGKASWARWLALDAPPLYGGIADYSVPGGSFIIDWESYSSRIVWAGWTLNEGQASTRVNTGFLEPGTVKGRWASSPFETAFAAPLVFSIDHSWGGWEAGGASASLDAALKSPDFGPLGTLKASSWAFWGGTEAVKLFYAEGSGNLDASKNIIFWWFRGTGSAQAKAGGAVVRGLTAIGPVSLKWGVLGGAGQLDVKADLARSLFGEGDWSTREESRVRVQALWLDQSWDWDRWSVGLDGGGGLFWIENPTWTQQHSWTETTLVWTWPFVINVNKTSSTDYTLEANPGWVLVLHPRVAWRPAPGWSLEVSRWLPLSGGFRFARSDEPTASNSSESPGNSDSHLDTRNLWLAGTQFQLSVGW